MTAAAPTILVVDDDDEVCTLVCHILRDQGYVVDAVSDGRQALERTRAQPADLMLLDLILPGTDGWAVLEQLRGIPGAPAVVGLTALDSYETFKGFVREGVAGYLGKPFRFQDLVDICRRLLEARMAPAHPVPEERRQLPRREILVGVRVLSSPERAILGVGEIVNLSRNGAHVHLGAPLDPGARVRLAFQMSGGEPSGFEARVRWRADSPRGFAHGVEFINLRVEDVIQLRELLEPLS